MAVITPTFAQPAKGVVVVTWASMDGATSDTGTMVTTAQYSRKYVQSDGTYTGGTVAYLMASNDGTNQVVCKDNLGNNIGLASDDGEEVHDSPLEMAPSVVGGTGVITVTLTLGKD